MTIIYANVTESDNRSGYDFQALNSALAAMIIFEMKRCFGFIWNL